MHHLYKLIFCYRILPSIILIRRKKQTMRFACQSEYWLLFNSHKDNPHWAQWFLSLIIPGYFSFHNSTQPLPSTSSARKVRALGSAFVPMHSHVALRFAYLFFSVVSYPLTYPSAFLTELINQKEFSTRFTSLHAYRTHSPLATLRSFFLVCLHSRLW